MKGAGALDKVGIVGSTITALCCLGVSAVISALSAVGLGFLIHDAVLIPLLIVFLALTLLGLGIGWRLHRRPWAFLIAAAAAVSLSLSSFVWPSRPAAYASIGVLVLASIVNFVFGRTAHAAHANQ